MKNVEVTKYSFICNYCVHKRGYINHVKTKDEKHKCYKTQNIE
jgi:hypothetical protein